MTYQGPITAASAAGAGGDGPCPPHCCCCSIGERCCGCGQVISRDLMAQDGGRACDDLAACRALGRRGGACCAAAAMKGSNDGR